MSLKSLRQACRVCAFQNVSPYLISGQLVGQTLPKAIVAGLTVRSLEEWDKMSAFLLCFDLTSYFTTYWPGLLQCPVLPHTERKKCE